VGVGIEAPVAEARQALRHADALSALVEPAQGLVERHRDVPDLVVPLNVQAPAQLAFSHQLGGAADLADRTDEPLRENRAGDRGEQERCGSHTDEVAPRPIQHRALARHRGAARSSTSPKRITDRSSGRNRRLRARRRRAGSP
jgi:hypothetical protein